MGRGGEGREKKKLKAEVLSPDGGGQEAGLQETHERQKSQIK